MSAAVWPIRWRRRSGLTGSIVTIDVIGGEEMTFSQSYACPDHGVSMEELTPQMFSFNNPFGACETCTGLGTFMRVDPELILPNKKLSIREGAIKASGWYYAPGSISEMYYIGLGKKYGFDLDTPINKISKEGIQCAAVRHQRGKTDPLPGDRERDGKIHHRF